MCYINIIKRFNNQLCTLFLIISTSSLNFIKSSPCSRRHYFINLAIFITVVFKNSL
nr:MAG TPA_asm: hypothetical protein [Caudoviricetes sp.]